MAEEARETNVGRLRKRNVLGFSVVDGTGAESMIEGEIILMIGIVGGGTADSTTILLSFDFRLRLIIPRTLPVNQMMCSGLAETSPRIGTRETIGVPVGV